MEIQNWECKSLSVTMFEDRRLSEIKLNELGYEGWELVSTIQTDDISHAQPVEGYCTMVFKRPSQLPSDVVFTSDLKKPPRIISPAVLLRHCSCQLVR